MKVYFDKESSEYFNIDAEGLEVIFSLRVNKDDFSSMMITTKFDMEVAEKLISAILQAKNKAMKNGLK